MLEQNQIKNLLKRIIDDTENNKIKTAEDAIQKLVGELKNAVVNS